MIELYNEDCMEGMKRYPDKHFELAIVDPPYGINTGKGTAIYNPSFLSTIKMEQLLNIYVIIRTQTCYMEILFNGSSALLS